MTLYLDASVIVPLVITEPSSKATLAWVARQDAPFVVGRLAVGESASAISRRRRMNQLTDEQGERALAALDDWLGKSVVIQDHEPTDIMQAALLVRRPDPKLLMPDAIHLATCQRLGMRFVTADGDLTIVAQMLGMDWIMPA